MKEIAKNHGLSPNAQTAPRQSEAGLAETKDFEYSPEARTATGKLTRPKQMSEQVAAVRQVLAQGPLADTIAAQFKRPPNIAVQADLGALEEQGMVLQDADQYRLAS